MFYSITFEGYEVEFVLLSSYMVWREKLLIPTMLVNGFILLEAFVIPVDISMGIKLRLDVFPIL